jgi:hypothetical protein
MEMIAGQTARRVLTRPRGPAEALYDRRQD